jgi:uncharacterized membrane protein
MPKAEKTIIVSAPVEKVYAVFSNFPRFPEFMQNIKSIEMKNDRLSHWVAKGPLGTSVEWDAETTLMEPNKRIAWNSRDFPDNDITTSGQVTFTELGNNQTEVHVLINYDPPAGKVGEAVAKIFSDPQKELDEDLERFKTIVNEQRTYDQGRVSETEIREAGSQ